MCQNLVPLVNIKIAGKWMFIPLKMVLIGIDTLPCMLQMLSHVQRGSKGGCNNIIPDDFKTVAHKGQMFVRCNRWDVRWRCSLMFTRQIVKRRMEAEEKEPKKK
jgi:hypothetical protein